MANIEVLTPEEREDISTHSDEQWPDESGIKALRIIDALEQAVQEQIALLAYERRINAVLLARSERLEREVDRLRMQTPEAKAAARRLFSDD